MRLFLSFCDRLASGDLEYCATAIKGPPIIAYCLTVTSGETHTCTWMYGQAVEPSRLSDGFEFPQDVYYCPLFDGLRNIFDVSEVSVADNSWIQSWR